MERNYNTGNGHLSLGIKSWKKGSWINSDETRKKYQFDVSPGISGRLCLENSLFTELFWKESLQGDERLSRHESSGVLGRNFYS